MKLPRLLVLALCLVSTAFAEAGEEARARMKFAFDQLRANGGVAFASALYPESTPESETFGLEIARLAQPLGQFLDYEEIARTPLTKRLERVILAAHYTRGVFFLRIDVYSTETSWLHLSAKAAADASAILPTELLDIAGR